MNEPKDHPLGRLWAFALAPQAHKVSALALALFAGGALGLEALVPRLPRGPLLEEHLGYYAAVAAGGALVLALLAIVLRRVLTREEPPC